MNSYQQSFASLKVLLAELALPMADSLPLYEAPDPEDPREDHVLWHFGHAIQDVARGLVEPSHRWAAPFGDLFLGPRGKDPFEGPIPEFQAIWDWYERLCQHIEPILEHWKEEGELPEPFELFDGTLYHTRREVMDYVLFHSGLHIGRCHQLLGW